MNRFAEMKTFVNVIESGSLSAAADQLGVAVSAVSRRIKELEERLGVRLANRSTRGLSPTPLGQAYYERCVYILSELENADSLIGNNVDKLHGKTRFSIPQELGKEFVVPIVIEFAKSHPDSVLDIMLSDREVDLVTESYDFAIRIGAPQDTNLNTVKVGEISYSVAASPGFWEQYGHPETPMDLEGMPLLAYRAAMMQGKLFYEHQAQSHFVRLKPRILSNSGKCLIQAAIAGLGICLEPDFMLAPALQSGQLESVLSHCSWFRREVYVVSSKGRPMSILAQRLIDKITERLAVQNFSNHSCSELNN
ncbi:LysR family transcriptional regulator [Thalassotalea insulae]|uniref:LysR family transcriptional regulator n=1 Tax=Thalassotalea insulae TaxID=2056778 RepID=A0ABQ6GMR3_9GAMM|nr:LysR family transcriptional regulator [Thalassotalea insulae]GLX77217.1 LysR family transcriptional regulator [Thalassotalea insulae]